MNELKEQLKSIIQKQVNFSKLTYNIEIKVVQRANLERFPKHDIKICIKEEFINFREINQETKEIVKEIGKINSRYLVKFIFEKCDVKFWNEDINLYRHINFKDSNVNINVQDIELDEIYLLSLNFNNCTFENLRLLSNVKTLHIDLRLNNIKLLWFVGITMTDNGINKIDINDTHIEQVIIKDSAFKRDFTIYRSKIDSIEIKNVDFESLSEFNEVTFQNKFDFKEISYKGYALFDKCIFNAKAEFEYIIFEKFTSFRKSEFKSGLNLDITSCDKEINFFGTRGLDSTDSKNNTSQETYRIIKNNFEKIGNKIEANKYHSLELERKRVDIEENKWKNIGDYIVFKLHYISSNHSTNWVLALLWIILVGFLTIIFLHLNVVKELFINPCSFKIEHFYKIFDNLWKYIYIGNMDDELKRNSFIFLFNKVSLGYLYYQFLTAVRKDTRK
jgi:orfc667-5